MLKPSSLFGYKFLLMNYAKAKRHYLRSSMLYPDRLWTVWLFQISIFNSVIPGTEDWQLLKKPSEDLLSLSNILTAKMIEHAAMIEGL